MTEYAVPFEVLAVFFVVAVAFASVPLLLARIIAPRKPSQTKLDTYECGLESRGDSWVQLNVQYYIYALAFVAFDLESPFLYAWACVFNKLPLQVFFEMLVFIAVLMVGLIYAWRKGVLEWK